MDAQSAYLLELLRATVMRIRRDRWKRRVPRVTRRGRPGGALPGFPCARRTAVHTGTRTLHRAALRSSPERSGRPMHLIRLIGIGSRGAVRFARKPPAKYYDPR